MPSAAVTLTDLSPVLVSRIEEVLVLQEQGRMAGCPSTKLRVSNITHGALHESKLPKGQMLPISSVQGDGKHC